MAWTVLLADDEYFIRQRIKKIIPWEEMGLTLAGEAENGQEVLSLLAGQPVNILLLDIRMPKLTGIDVAHYIHHHYPEIKIIILSGYHEFEYARAAIRTGVIDYLLKPVSPEDLKETLSTCIKLIEREQQLYRYEKSLALTQVLNGAMSYEQLQQTFAEFSAFTHCFYTGIYFADNGHSLLTELADLLTQQGFFQVTRQDSETQFIIQVFQSFAQISKAFDAILQKFMLLHKAVFIYVGKPFLVTEPWQPHDKECARCILLRYFYRLPAFIDNRGLLTGSSSQIDFQSIRPNVTKFFYNQHLTDFKSYIHLLFDKIAASKNQEHLYLLVHELFLTYALFTEKNRASSNLVQGLVSSILEEEISLQALMDAVTDYGIACIQHDKASPADVIISKKIIHQIEQNFSDPVLSVTQLADFFQLNVSYMGSIFKKVNDQSILQYMTAYRMEQAKKLLGSGQYRIFEVAELVGYTDVFYFSKKFKKMFGCSPKEFSNLLAE